MAAAAVSSAFLTRTVRYADAISSRAFRLRPGTLPTQPAAAVFPALHADARRLASADSGQTLFLKAGTLSAGTVAPVRPALHLSAIGLAHATGVNALVLLARARAALTAAAVVATLFAPAVRYAGAHPNDTLLLEAAAVLDHAIATAAVVVPARLVPASRNTHAVSVLALVLVAGALSTSSSATVVSALLVLTCGKAACSLRGADFPFRTTRCFAQFKRTLALPRFHTDLTLIAVTATPAAAVAAAILVQAVGRTFASPFYAHVRQFAFPALVAATVVSTLLAVAIRGAHI